MIWINGEDLGSIETTGSEGNKYSFIFLSRDFDKLPKYMVSGSTAYACDTKKMYIYHAHSKTWYEM